MVRRARTPSKFPGVEVVDTAVRTYPQGSLAAHILGYTGLIQADEYDAAEGPGVRAERHRRAGRARVGLREVPPRHAGQDRSSSSTPTATDPHARLDRPGARRRPASVARTTGCRSSRRRRCSTGWRTPARRCRTRRGTPQGERRFRDRAGREHRRVVAMVTTPTFDPSWYVHGLTAAQAKYLIHNTNAALRQQGDPGRVHTGLDVQVDHRARGHEGGHRIARRGTTNARLTTRRRVTSREPSSTTGRRRTSAT